MVRKLLSILFLLITLFTGGQEVTVRIVATSDVHGALFPRDLLSNSTPVSSLASVQTFTDSIRNIPGANLILLDNGDLIQGTPAAYFANFVQKNNTNLFARVLNYMKFDAATVGNHDIEAGPDIYYQLQEEFNFPWLGANIICIEDSVPVFAPYTIIERQGIKIAVLGLITPGVPGWLPQTLWQGLAFNGITESAEYWVEHIRKIDTPDAIIGLFHTGMGQITNDLDSSLPENAGLQTAIQVSGLDVVVLGHDHRPKSEKVKNKSGTEVTIINPGSAARNIAYAELTFALSEGDKYTLTEVNARIVNLENTAPSKDYVRKFRTDMKAATRFAHRPLGKLTRPLAAQDGLFGSSAFTDLIHELQLTHTEADVSFTAPLTIRENLKRGRVLMRDLFKLYRYENFLYVMELSGTEIRHFLEYSYSLWFNRMSGTDDHLLNFRKGADNKEILQTDGRLSLANPSFNFDSAAGILYEVDVSMPEGQRIKITGMEDGLPFFEDKIYRVAVNSYRGSGGGGHLTRGAGIEHHELAGRIIYTSELDIRTLLAEYFETRKTITPMPRGNWKIIPKEWRDSGMANDLKAGF
jgi:2',3'-cyclic-nucleotide 2'-phosphodiesterase/3'-nucleotidase